jgi:hypothetical protein
MTGAGTWYPPPSTQRNTFQKQKEINNGRNADADA